MYRVLTTALFSLLLLTSSYAAKSTHKEPTPPKITPVVAIKAEADSSKNPGAASPIIAAALRIDTRAEQAIIIDHHTGKVLYEKNADQLMYPSSMTKIMTAYMIFDRLNKGIISLDSTVPVSKNAWKMQGSKMFLSIDSQVSFKDLLKGIIIQSGNDACIAAAEGICGTEEVFAAEMTQKAKEFGAINTNFKNASGWPDPEHYTTARDLALMAQHVINDYPEYYSLFGDTEYSYNNITQQNRNPLLYKNVGCDGLKTGHTDAGRYGLVASSKEIDSNGSEMRVDIVINGLPSSKIRSEEAVKLMTWAMKTFSCYSALKKGEVVETAKVWLGKSETVALTVAEDVRLVIPQVVKKDIKVDIKYDGPISAPIAVNQVIGKATISGPTIDTPIEVPLVAAQAIERAGFFKRISASLSYLIWGQA